MNWIKKLFKSNSHNEKLHLSREEEILVQLDGSIAKCTMDIKKAGEETDQIKKWATEAILEVFQVPNKLWYSEIANYEAIKLLDENKNIDIKVIIKCDEVIAGYMEQIKLRDTKILLYNTLIQKYSETKQKMETVKNKRDGELKAQSKLHALEKHSQRIDQLRNNPENVDVDETNQLEIIKGQIKEVIDEFEISEEVRGTLEEINRQFVSGKQSFTAKSAIDEIEKLMEKIKKQD
jgi:hypothetical protein